MSHGTYLQENFNVDLIKKIHKFNRQSGSLKIMQIDGPNKQITWLLRKEEHV